MASTVEQQREVLGRVAAALARRGLAPVAIFALESVKPLSFVASQVLLVLGPLVGSFLPVKDYRIFCDALEDRKNVEWLIQRLEESGE